MQRKIGIIIGLFIIMGGLSLFTISCSDDTPNPTKPVLTTSGITSITRHTATCGGFISSDGGALITVRGVCYSQTPYPTKDDLKTTDSTGKGVFVSNLTGLTANTIYYIRAYATNSAGTEYGEMKWFITLPILFVPGIGVSDIDGNAYTTIICGTQEWMVENLKTTKYNDGTDIPLVTDPTAWWSLGTAGFCWYKNDETTYKSTYGAIYNWYAVNTGKLCPTGWHVPTITDWVTLVTYLGGDTLVGGKLKETGTDHWMSPNYGANNYGGFTALPAGSRNSNGTFENLGYIARWWTSTETSDLSAWYRSLSYSNSASQKGYGSKTFGYSVRCVKN
jgi:uncharacterized protein (TIGR02145 family)